MNELQIPNSCTFVDGDYSAEDHVWTIQFACGHRTVVTAVNNVNNTTTYYINDVIMWWSLNQSDVEEMLLRFATHGTWDTRKPI